MRGDANGQPVRVEARLIRIPALMPEAQKDALTRAIIEGYPHARLTREQVLGWINEGRVHAMLRHGSGEIYFSGRIRIRPVIRLEGEAENRRFRVALNGAASLRPLRGSGQDLWRRV